MANTEARQSQRAANANSVYFGCPTHTRPTCDLRAREGVKMLTGEERNGGSKHHSMPAPVQMKTLLEAGVHFGHQTRRWDPRMRPFIFTERNGIHIIDLQQTVKCLEDTMGYVRELSARGGVLLFVGTKKQAQETIEE